MEKKSSFNCRPKKILDNQHLLKVHKCYQREAMLRRILQIFLTIIILFSIHIFCIQPLKLLLFSDFPNHGWRKCLTAAYQLFWTV